MCQWDKTQERPADTSQLNDFWRRHSAALPEELRSEVKAVLWQENDDFDNWMIQLVITYKKARMSRWTVSFGCVKETKQEAKGPAEVCGETKTRWTSLMTSKNGEN